MGGEVEEWLGGWEVWLIWIFEEGREGRKEDLVLHVLMSA